MSVDAEALSVPVIEAVIVFFEKGEGGDLEHRDLYMGGVKQQVLIHQGTEGG